AYQLYLDWDTSKPDGQMVKIFDTARLKGLGLSCDTPLREGLTKTIEWFAKNYETRGDGLRL
ncbi:MAG TPA: GDP-fucose synthetase, partial [Alphaproteobacteria bacterium]|nr:GDP-fucose synthetase [Alphaproteobacteria bacterium]